MTELSRGLVFSLLPAAIAGLDWTEWLDGVQIHRLYGTGTEGPSAAFLRYAPGASVPLHEHMGYEHVLVVTGAQEDHAGVYCAGTMVVNPPGSRHLVWSREGCTVLLVWERPVIVLDWS